MKNNKSKFLPHVYLENLIRKEFNPYLVVRHDRFDDKPILNSRNRLIRARTVVAAYKSKEDAARLPDNPVTYAYAECAVADRFERAKGLNVAYNRLYRELVNLKK